MANQDTETTLYNGAHTAVFKNGQHRYYIDGTLRPGVTTILSAVLAKPALMLWPLNMAMNYLKTRLPHLTAEDLAEAAQAHVTRRDAGASTGTVIHGLVEDYLRNKGKVMLPEYHNYPEDVCLAALSFDAWFHLTGVKPVAVEQVVYSQTLGFAGTFDSILKIKGKNYLCDLKTTNASRDAPKGVYADYFIQLGGYLYAYEEQRQYELAHGGTELVQIDDVMIISCRKDGAVSAVTASALGLSLDTCMKLWAEVFYIYKELGTIKKKLAGGFHG